MVAIIGALAGAASAATAAGPLVYLDIPDVTADVVIDARPAAACASASLPEARCLPAQDFLGPHRRLANISGVLWQLGTAGLTGDEHVLVVGEADEEREFLAGLLYLAGQRKVSLQTIPVSELLKTAKSRTAGRPRAMTRQSVFQAPMRDASIVLRSELAHLIGAAQAPILLDGRSENEYWGKTILAQRGGHLPGAQHLPARSLTAAYPGAVQLPRFASGEKAIAYAQGAFDGLVYLARLINQGVEARLYLEGWAGWASDGALPADSLTFPARSIAVSAPASTPVAAAPPVWRQAVLAGLAGTTLAVGGFLGGRLSRRQT